jgi:hypothetical protein
MTAFIISFLENPPIRRPSSIILTAILIAAALAPMARATVTGAADPYGFVVEVSLSPKANAKLAKLHETITVSASFYGDPAPSAIKHADEVGQINLGRAMAEIPGAGGRAVISGAGVRRERLAWLATPPEVNVNVFTSRHSGPDNLLDCAFFQDAVTAARKEPVKLACKLIGER